MDANAMYDVYSPSEFMAEAPETIKLCSACRMLSFKDLKDGYEHPWIHERIARSGLTCRLCRLITCSMGRLQMVEVDSYSLNRKYELSLQGFETLPAVSRHQIIGELPFEVLRRPEKVSWSRVDYKGHSGPQVRRGNFNQGETISITTPPTSDYARDGLVAPRCVESASSRPIYDKIRKWLDHCVANHGFCRVPDYFDSCNGEETALPTRVIDLGPPDNESWKPRLLVTSGEIGRFVALSHRWGAKEVRMLKENIDDFRKRLPIESLSRTFKDAMEVTRQLRCRYLWIDSLCIIQDDGDDWARESDRMGRIFGSSYCTIAAVGAKEGARGDQGLFECRDSDPLAVSLALPLRIEPLSKLSRNVFKSSQETFVWKYGYLRSSRSSQNMVTICPRRISIPKRMVLTEWYWRAWIYQERTLSRRVLYYTIGKVYWDCFQEKGEEEGADPVQPHRNPWISSHGDHPLPVSTVWSNAVENYSRSCLTLNKDRLKAISGLSNLLCHSFHVAIHAGVLEDKTLESLLWFTKKPQTQTFNDFHAPSWSWASINAPVHTKLFGTPPSCVILARNVSYTTEEACQDGGERGSCKGACISGEVSFVSAGSTLTRANRLREFVKPDGEEGPEALYDDTILKFLLGTAVLECIGPCSPVPRYDERFQRILPPRWLPVPEHTEVLYDQCGCCIGFYVPDAECGASQDRSVFCVAIKSWGTPLRVNFTQVEGCDYEEHIVDEKCIEVLGLRAIEDRAGVYQRIGRGRIICNTWLGRCVEGSFTIL